MDEEIEEEEGVASHVLFRITIIKMIEVITNKIKKIKRIKALLSFKIRVKTLLFII